MVGEYPAALIWDQFPAHRITDIIDRATAHNIEIIPVPEGMTGSEQPLDRFVFGPMKKIAIRLWGEAMAQNNDISYTRSSAAKIMVQSWNEVSKDCLIKAWENIITNQE